MNDERSFRVYTKLFTKILTLIECRLTQCLACFKVKSVLLSTHPLIIVPKNSHHPYKIRNLWIFLFQSYKFAEIIMLLFKWFDIKYLYISWPNAYTCMSGFRICHLMCVEEGVMWKCRKFCERWERYNIECTLYVCMWILCVWLMGWKLGCF